ncbi:MAG: hypothetical protein WCC59_15650 [Terriglobales bacterium]
MSFLFAVTVALVVGYGLASTVRVPGANRQDVLLLQLGLAPGIGLGVLSLWYFVALAAGVSAWAEVEIEILAAAGAVAWIYFARERNPATALRAQPGFVVAAIISVAGVFSSFWIRYMLGPLGGWDAFAIWNAHARILGEAGQGWCAAMRATNHPDYPVLLPVTIARLWHAWAAEPTWIPALVGFLFLLGSILVLYGAAAIIAGRDAACVGIVVMSINGAVPVVASSQYADWPLAYYFTACFALALQGRRTVFLAGLMAGLAAWTKNEGLLFALVVTLVVAALDRRALASLLPPLGVVAAVVFWYKWAVHVPSDLFHQSRGQVIEGVADLRPLLMRVTDHHRLWSIMSSMTGQLAGFALLLVPVLILAGWTWRTAEPGGSFPRLRPTRELQTCVVALLMMVAGYTAIYVISPFNVQWHIGTSVYRLFAQLWPATVLCTLVATMPSSKNPPLGNPGQHSA